MDRLDIQKKLARRISKIGNAIPIYNHEGKLQLFFVTVGFGGWSVSCLNLIESNDDGMTWSDPKRLVTSPFINISTAVKGAGVLFNDTTIGLPVYNELALIYGEFLRISSSGQTLDKRRISCGWGNLQPIIFSCGLKNFTAYFRSLKGRIAVAESSDCGKFWSKISDLPICNPDAAIAGINLDSHYRILVLNDSKLDRTKLSIYVSCQNDSNIFKKGKITYSPWKFFYRLEEAKAIDGNDLMTYSYPFMDRNSKGDICLVYSYGLNKIKSVFFNSKKTSKFIKNYLNNSRKPPLI